MEFLIPNVLLPQKSCVDRWDWIINNSKTRPRDLGSLSLSKPQGTITGCAFNVQKNSSLTPIMSSGSCCTKHLETEDSPRPWALAVIVYLHWKCRVQIQPACLPVPSLHSLWSLSLCFQSKYFPQGNCEYKNTSKTPSSFPVSLYICWAQQTCLR